MSGTDLWAGVFGQDDAVRRLRAAARSPTHAYLISGPAGSGKRAIARAFAAELLSRNMDEKSSARVRHLVAGENHPSLIVVEREGPYISATDARGVVERASRSPLEGDLQIILMVDFHLVRDAGPMLLKVIEEPPPTTLFILLADELPIELETVASRCVNVGLSSVAESALVDMLVAQGVDPDLAAIAAAGAGGSVSRAALLARDPGVAQRRELWYRAAERLNGRGAAACAVADELLESISELKAPLEELQREELEDVTERAEAAGAEVRKGDLTRLRERHKREAKRMHVDELRVGLAVLVSRYRDDLLAGGDERAFLVAAEAVQELCDNLTFNATDSLALQALLMSLPQLDGT